MDYSKITSADLKNRITDAVQRFFGVKPEEASNTQMYKAVCIVVRDMLTNSRVDFKRTAREINAKHVYYMSMEFLLGRSLRNHLFNMGIDKKMVKAVKDLGFDIDTLYAIEPDAGLGNGGLGRLAAAYLDSLTSLGYIATGFSIMYDYGIFKQRIVDGEQIELPDEITWGDERIKHALVTALKLNCIVLHKGCKSIIASPEGEIAVNSSGSPALATAGSGDVLSGLIGAFASSGEMSLFNAVICGVFVHGRAGENTPLAMRSLIADDLPDLIAGELRKLSPFA